MRNSISCYLIFVKESQKDSSVHQSETKEDLELSNFLQRFQEIFTDDIPRELLPTRGRDDHSIDIIPGNSPPNKPPYRVSHTQ